MIGSMGAELKGAITSRPLGLPEPKGQAAHDEAWAHVVKNFAKVPAKESALAMLETLTIGRRQAAEALQAGMRGLEARARNGLGTTLAARFKQTLARKAVERIIDKASEAAAETSPVLQAAAARRVVPAVSAPAVPVQRRVKVSEVEAQAQLAAFMGRHGLRTDGPPIMDGERHYVQVDGDKGRAKAGAYMAFYEGVRPAGVVWNYKTGLKANWKADGELVEVSAAEQRAARDRADADRAARAREQQQREDRGAAKAQTILDASKPATSAHPYLAAKGVQAHGLRETADGLLVMPMRTVEGRLMNVQTIDASGEKRFLYGAKKLDLFHLIGGPVRAGMPLYIAEGYATAASVHEATGAPVAVAIDTSNLGPAARALRAAHPGIEMAMAADNDAHLPLRDAPRTRPNAGMSKATDVAADVRARVLAPTGLADRTTADKGTDWNDYAAAHGLDGVRTALGAAWRASEVPVARDTPAPVQRAPGLRMRSV